MLGVEHPHTLLSVNDLAKLLRRKDEAKLGYLSNAADYVLCKLAVDYV